METPTLIDLAMKRFPKAKRIAVANFSSGYSELSMEAEMNLEMDTASYKWNTHTVNAIRWVIKNTHAFKTMAD